MSDPSKPQSSFDVSDQKIAGAINVVMVSALSALVILFALWEFAANIGPAATIYDGLPAHAKQTLFAVFSSGVLLLVGLRLVSMTLRKLVARR
jgi:hypothetical protein